MTAVCTPSPVTRFTLPDGSAASEPAEYRGLHRDGIRLLAARAGGISHRRFHELPELLQPGDLLVVNTSPTLPAAVEARLGNGEHRPLHVSTPLDNGDWVIEVRLADNSGPERGLAAGESLRISGGHILRLLCAYPDPSAGATRLWRVAVPEGISHAPYLREHGRPISYGYQQRRFPLADYQTVYATDDDAEPVGSAEMASAGRPLTAQVLTRAMSRGITVAPIVLHAGVASPEAHEPPMPERFAVPAITGRLVEATRAAGGRIVAVGTTVVRALETAARPNGRVPATQGWTDLVLGPERAPRVVGGLVSGLHEPEASHLLLLEAVAGPELVAEAYAAAVAERYLWHEFGDSMLFLP
ncbi:MAG: S-adenosylmethionine:tRNA ribosyltransferase-isomerase [Actinomycetota bacterium]|nr:S-adenosylmethionine:tRNA ribosyltransferase-isomerase [Actinomycetota bacterium]